VHQVFEIVWALPDAGLTVLLVEQNAKQALQVSDRAYVLETGRIVLSGDSEALLESPDVQKAYLGGRRSSGSGASPASWV
jgi:branched-chain amino acid transport system ATP-binding protein